MKKFLFLLIVLFSFYNCKQKPNNSKIETSESIDTIVQLENIESTVDTLE